MSGSMILPDLTYCKEILHGTGRITAPDIETAAPGACQTDRLYWLHLAGKHPVALESVWKAELRMQQGSCRTSRPISVLDDKVNGKTVNRRLGHEEAIIIEQ